MVACLNVLSKYYSVVGLFFILPCIDDFKKIDMRTLTYDVPPQEVGFHFCWGKSLIIMTTRFDMCVLSFNILVQIDPHKTINQSINQKRKHWVGSLQKWHRVIHTPSFSHTLIVFLTSTYLNAGQVSSKFFSFLICHHIVICETIYINKCFLFLDSYQRLCHSGCGCSYLHQNFWRYHGNSKCVWRIAVYRSVSRHHTQKRPGN